MTTIRDLSCAALTAAYRSGALSPVEVARDVLARIERHKAFNAFLAVEPEAVLEMATESEARWRRGTPLGDIDGVPASVKDNVTVKRLPTRRGSRTTETRPAQADAPAVARIREQGAVILGKTCMPEHGWIGVCHSPLTGITRNPWNPDCTPGGSTGGGAVAALLGLGVLHIGTDGAGSLRIPAAFTGVFGIKPSFGRVPVYPTPPNVVSHHGPIARSVADAAKLLSVIAQPDPRDMTGWTAPAPDYVACLDEGVRGLRIALSTRLGHVAALDPEIEAATRKAARALEAQGAHVEEADPPLDRAPELIRALWWPSATALVDSVPEARRAEIDPGLRALAERGRRYSMADYLAAYAARTDMHVAMLRFHERYDLLLTPAMPLTALKVGQVMPETGDYGDDWLNWSPYTYAFNLTRAPAASVPSGLASNGLPMGVQLAARIGHEATILRAARVLEQALPMPAVPVQG